MVASNHCQHMIAKPIDSVIEERPVALDELEQAIAEREIPVSFEDFEEGRGEIFGTCRDTNPFDVSPQCPRGLTSKGLSRITQE